MSTSKTIRTTVALVATLSLASVAPAAAEVPPQAQQDAAVAAAIAYWGGVPTDGCLGSPLPLIVYADLGPDGAGGLAYIGACQIQINDAVTWQHPDGSWGDLCHVMLHEWGHLMLGSDPFAADNPTDPGHSLDPTNIMFGGQAGYGTVTPACVAMATPTVTPPAPPTVAPAVSTAVVTPHVSPHVDPVPRHRRHHHRRHNHHRRHYHRGVSFGRGMMIP